MNNHENTNTSRFYRFCCCAAETTSSCSSMCICDWESRSLKSSSLAILHQERVNKVFGKRSSRLLAHFVKFFTTARLPLRRSCVEGHYLQHELRQADRRLHLIVVREPQVTYGSSSQIISYIFNMLICVGMILRDSLLQCLLFIATIDLSITCGTAASLIYYALVMFLIYPWIKIKLKVLIFPTIQKSYCSHFSFIAGFVDALRYTSFTGANFKRWQMSHIVANCHERVLGVRGQTRGRTFS
jgi:hypothetical protein